MLDSAASNSNEASVVLGGGLKKERGKWRTTNLDEGDNFGICGDRLRVVACSYLFLKNPKQLVICSGGKGQLENIKDAPPVSSILKKELVALGIPEEKIVEENKSRNTFEQLLYLKKIIMNYDIKLVSIISNRWHVLRIKAMLGVFPELVRLKELSQIKLIEAEKVVLENDAGSWKQKIDFAYNGPAFKRRVAAEKRGICDIRSGNYKINLTKSK